MRTQRPPRLGTAGAGGLHVLCFSAEQGPPEAPGRPRSKIEQCRISLLGPAGCRLVMYAPQTGRAWSGKLKIGRTYPSQVLSCFSAFQTTTIRRNKYENNSAAFAGAIILRCLMYYFYMFGNLTKQNSTSGWRMFWPILNFTLHALPVWGAYITSADKVGAKIVHILHTRTKIGSERCLCTVSCLEGTFCKLTYIF
jgi:hypothetical protein